MCLLLAAVGSARARGQGIVPTSLALGTPVLDGDALTRLELDGRQKELASFEVNEVAGHSFRQAVRISTLAGAASEWNAQLRVRPSASIQSGDVLLARFWMRCTESMTDEGFTGFVYECTRPDFDKAVEVRLAATAQWTEYFVPFRAARDFPREESQICFRVGFDRQTIELGGIEIVNFGAGAKLEELPRTRISYIGRSAEAPWRREALARIDRIRKGDLVVRVTDAVGKPIEGASVHAVLKRHAFGFGSCVTVEHLLDPSPDGQQYRQIVERYFNQAVFENDMKWPAVYDGAPARLDQATHWLFERGIRVRGHNLFWPGWRWLPRQLRQHENDPSMLRAIAEKHVTEIVSHFKGRLFEWDVVNEPYSNHDLMDLLGGNNVMIHWFKLAKQADPQCRMYLNDFGILEGGPDGAHARHFYETIRFLRKGGAPIDGIGIQSHFAAALPAPTQVLKTLDRFSEFGLPIQLTEVSLNCDERELQADYLRDLLIAGFSHPNVLGIMLWGFWEKRHWRPQAALYNADWSVRPHGQTWLDLVHGQWKTDETPVSDAAGRAAISGFCGEYEISISAGGRSSTIRADLPREGRHVNAVLE